MRPRVRCRTHNRGYPDAHSIELTAAQLLDECDQLFEQRGRTGSLHRCDHKRAQLTPMQRASGNLGASEIDPYDDHGSWVAAASSTTFI
jgi:hypothetical protein